MIVPIIDILCLCVLVTVYILVLRYFKLDRKQAIAVAVCLLSYGSAVVTAPLIGQLMTALF